MAVFLYHSGSVSLIPGVNGEGMLSWRNTNAAVQIDKIAWGQAKTNKIVYPEELFLLY